MSDTDNGNTTASGTTDQGAQGDAGKSGANGNTNAGGALGTETAPPWGSAEDFNPDKAWKLIQNLRADHKKAQDRVREFEDKDKTELQRATDKAADAESRALVAELNALRLDVALDKAPEGMSVAQVRKLAKRLTGKDRAELEADAAELFAEFTPSTKESTPSGTSRPKERLRPGASSATETDETDPVKLAARVPRMY
jgi:hypothetical protein